MEETLVVVMCEMGRTPLINASGGRDHWTLCYSVLLAGGRPIPVAQDGRAILAQHVVREGDVPTSSLLSRQMSPLIVPRCWKAVVNIDSQLAANGSGRIYLAFSTYPLWLTVDQLVSEFSSYYNTGLSPQERENLPPYCVWKPTQALTLTREQAEAKLYASSLELSFESGIEVFPFQLVINSYFKPLLYLSRTG